MASEFSKSRMDLPCPECGSNVRATLDDIRAQRTKPCARGHRVKLEDSGGGVAKADREMKKLEKSLKRLGR